MSIRSWKLWSSGARSTPLVLMAEGMEGPDGNEVESRVFPAGANESDAQIRLIIDPIDGTRGHHVRQAACVVAGGRGAE